MVQLLSFLLCFQHLHQAAHNCLHLQDQEICTSGVACMHRMHRNSCGHTHVHTNNRLVFKNHLKNSRKQKNEISSRRATLERGTKRTRELPKFVFRLLNWGWSFNRGPRIIKSKPSQSRCAPCDLLLFELQSCSRICSDKLSELGEIPFQEIKLLHWLGLFLLSAPRFQGDIPFLWVHCFSGLIVSLRRMVSWLHSCQSWSVNTH